MDEPSRSGDPRPPMTAIVARLLARIGLVALFVTSPSSPAFAGPAELDVVQRGVAEVTAARVAVATSPNAPLPPRLERAGQLIERYVDVPTFASRVLADVESELTPANRKVVVDAIRALLTTRIALRLPDVPSTAPRVEGAREEGGELRVRVAYHDGAAGLDNVEVDLVFGGAERGRPRRIIDAVVSGVSLSKNLRASVNKVTRKEGVDGLVVRLRQRAGQTTSGPHKSSDLTL